MRENRKSVQLFHACTGDGRIWGLCAFAKPESVHVGRAYTCATPVTHLRFARVAKHERVRLVLLLLLPRHATRANGELSPLFAASRATRCYPRVAAGADVFGYPFSWSAEQMSLRLEPKLKPHHLLRSATTSSWIVSS